MDSEDKFWLTVVTVITLGVSGGIYRGCQTYDKGVGQKNQIVSDCIKSGKEPAVCKDVFHY